MTSQAQVGHRQSPEQSNYAGSSLLLKAEDDLKRYNSWIVDSFISRLPRPVSPGASALDFGAGIGTLSRIFEARTGVRPEGVELDPGQRELLAARGFTSYSTLEQARPCYDLIFTSNVLEHIDDDVAALVALRARMGDSSVLAVYVPAFMSIWTAMDDRVGHYRRYRKHDLSIKLEQAGFRVCTARYCDSLGYLLSFLFKFIGNKDGDPSSRSLRIFDRFLLPVSRIGDWFFAPFFGKNVLVIAEPATHVAP